MDAVLAIETVALVCPRSADVMQAGNFGAIRVLAEYGTADQKKTLPRAACSRGEAVISRRHDRARRRLGGDRPQDHARRRTATAIASTAPRSSPRTRLRRRHPRLRALRPGRRRHRLGADRDQGARRPEGQAVARSCPARSGHDLPSTTSTCRRRCVLLRRRRLQEADRRLQRRAHRQHRALARARALLLRARARTGRSSASSSAACSPSSRACSGSSPT